MASSTNEEKCVQHTADLNAKNAMKELLMCNSFKLNEKLLQAVNPHIASFNTFINFFIPEMIKDLSPIYVDPLFNKQNDELNPFYTSSEYLKISIRRVIIGKPSRYGSDTTPLYPVVCRNAHMTYSSPLFVEFVHHHSKTEQILSITKRCGRIPIMVGSCLCHLAHLTPEEKVQQKEEANETGGYFIVNGNERLIRFVIQQRCNHPIALSKPRFSERDLFFSDSAIFMRCAKKDGTSTLNILFYTQDRQCAFRVLINRQEVFVNFWTLLRALMPDIPATLVKKKLFEAAFQDTMSNVNVSQKSVLGLLEIDQLWEEFMNQETLFCDVDAYENRYLHQLGKQYWDLVSSRIKPNALYEDAGRYVIDQYILVHCDTWTSKFEILILLYQKLLLLVRGEISAENMDSFAYQEVMTPGHLFASVLKDALNNALSKIKLNYTNDLRITKAAAEDPLKIVQSRKHFEVILLRVCNEISYSINYFISTGNIKTHQLDLQQLSGWTIVADRLNMNRFLSHFRAVHRGQFFMQMRTTEVRKLLGETWGFLCPVHTPDGGPCGLLLHLAQGAVPVTDHPNGRAMAGLKTYLHRRQIPTQLTGDIVLPPNTFGSTFVLVFDGQILCRLPTIQFDYWVNHLRDLKQKQLYGLPNHLEIAAFPPNTRLFPGIFIFSYPGRLVRAVKHLQSNTLEFIGPLSQPWMHIACVDEEVNNAKKCWEKQEKTLDPFFYETSQESTQLKTVSVKDISEDLLNTKKKKKKKCQTTLQEVAPVKYTHIELSPNLILSITAALTPFSHNNQSPRNMYQCQMLKQTMATPFYSIPYRTDNKAYRLIYPQYPLVTTQEYQEYQWNEHPSGTNAIVAVISYTGFDMEDAMILNKASMERGAFHATVYKTKVIDAAPASARGVEAQQYRFSNSTPEHQPILHQLDTDGLPSIGTMLKKDTPFYRTTTVEGLSSDSATRPTGQVFNYHDDEMGYVDKVNFISYPDAFKESRLGSKGETQRVSLKIRCMRNPVVGDKFASRAGQKGILSFLWPQEDMPFTASGIVPDIVFNPHGFPSRMTVGMLLESIAGKAAAVYGSYQDATPFRTYEKHPPTPHTCKYHKSKHGNDKDEKSNCFKVDSDESTETSVDYFGKALQRAGYQYYGSEPMYSGIHGMQMDCHIFIGIIYYQRLRHMVSDKWQVRSTGPIDILTRQPVKGRKRGGGVRFGEMERDAVLAHGASSFLQDRLLNCSDAHDAFVCPQCGSILSPSLHISGGRSVGGKKSVAECRICKVPCCLVSLPFVFRYICNELATMNVTIKLQVSQNDRILSSEKTIKESSETFKTLQQDSDISHDGTVESEVNFILGTPAKKELMHDGVFFNTNYQPVCK